MSLRYLLDTNICIYVAKHRPAEVYQRLSRLRTGEAVLCQLNCASCICQGHARLLKALPKTVPLGQLPEQRTCEELAVPDTAVRIGRASVRRLISGGTGHDDSARSRKMP